MRSEPGSRAAALLAAALVLGGQDSRPVQETAAAAGAVRGTIAVVKTRVKTDGPKSDKDVVVSLEPVPARSFDPPKEPVAMDQKNLTFIPHVLAVQKGTKVEFLNNDTVPHNAFCVDDCCGSMDLGQWNQGEKRLWTFNKAGVATILCRLHPEMAAHVVVLETPYFTVAEIDEKTQKATFEVKGLPPGRYRLRTWHKRLAEEEREVVVEEGKTASCDLSLSRRARRR